MKAEIKAALILIGVTVVLALWIVPAFLLMEAGNIWSIAWLLAPMIVGFVALAYWQILSVVKKDEAQKRNK
jgi:uncharacterized membrane protein YbhN (UPF0104 family)